MQCPQCRAQNREAIRFCEECGARLALTCPSCGAEVAADKKFCGSCGRSLAAQPEALQAPQAYTPKHLAQKILTSRSALEGERKQVTVLFCDIADSSRLAEQLDPEAMHEIIDRALRLMADTVHRYEGTVNQFLGDGLMALFGAPVALEDHALRAVQAALGIRETIGGYGEQLKRERSVEMRLRLGLNTGPVVVGRIGDDLRMDYTAIGETTHLAARMQSLAEPGTILVTEATHRLVEGYVRSEAIGPVRVKGRSEPLPAYKLTGRRRARTRLEVSAERGLTPLVGRERELGLLRNCVERVKAGRGQVVGIAGEAGVGKSRLLYELKQSFEGERLIWLEGHCVAYGQTTPYLPVLEILRANFHIEEDDNPLQIAEKLRQGLHLLDPKLEGILPFLSDLFGLPTEDEAFKKLDAKTKRQKTFDAIRALTMAGSQRRPHVVTVEDLHWLDKTSEDYLAFFIDSITAVPLLLITTHRPGHTVRWADKTYYTQIALDLLTDSDTEQMLARLLGARELPPELGRLVREKAEGNPLFVEEITRSLLERGLLVRSNGRVSWSGEARVELPPTAQDIIRARIDRLEEPVKRTAQMAAVIGREFTSGLLARLSEMPTDLPRHLETLRHAELIHETRFFPEPAYSFRHAIIQDVAYETLLVQRRKELHRAVGLAVQELHADRLADQYDLLAHHFSKAEEREKALEYLLKAGDKAGAAFANQEALAFYEHALKLVRENDVRSRAATSEKLATITVNLADPDASLRWAEAALELYDRLGDKRKMVAMHLHLNFLYAWNWDGAREYMSEKHLEQAAELTEGDPDSVEKGLLYQRMAHFNLHRCQPASTLAWAQRAVDLFAKLNVPMGTSLGTALLYTGKADDGVAYSEKHWDPVHKAANPLIMAIFGHDLCNTLALARDVPRAREWGEKVLPQVAKASPNFEAMLRRPLTMIYALAGEASKAEEASQAVERIEGRTLLGCIYEDAASVGFHHLRLGEWERARGYLERALSDHRDRYTVTAVCACSLALGTLSLELGDHAGAEELLLRSLEFCRNGGMSSSNSGYCPCSRSSISRWDSRPRRPST